MLNVQRTIKQFISAGCKGCFLEDQQWPKRMGHMRNKALIEMDEFTAKVRRRGRGRGCDCAQGWGFVVVCANVHLNAAVGRTAGHMHTYVPYMHGNWRLPQGIYSAQRVFLGRLWPCITLARTQPCVVFCGACGRPHLPPALKVSSRRMRPAARPPKSCAPAPRHPFHRLLQPGRPSATR